MNYICNIKFQQFNKRTIQTFAKKFNNASSANSPLPDPNEDPEKKARSKKKSNTSNNDNNMDNPLLNDNKLTEILKNKRKIQFPPSDISIQNIDDTEKLSDQWTRSLKNLQAVYGIICKENNKIYVGETENYKKRFLSHVKMLRNGNHSNKSLQNDFNELGRDETFFEFILFAVEDGNNKSHTSDNQVQPVQQTTVSNASTLKTTFETALDSSKRKALEAEIQEELIKLKLCYNTGLAETIQPRFQGLYPSEAGILFVKCKKTGKMGFFYSRFTNGIAGKIRQLKGKLNQGTYSTGNNPLELDWKKFGETGFEWGGYVWGSNYVDEKICKKIVNQLIYDNLSEKKEVYNTFYHDINSNEPNPNRLPLTTSLSELDLPITPPINPMTFTPGNFVVYNPPQNFVALGKKAITLMNQKSLFANGNVYLSINEAATAFDVNWNVIKTRLEKKEYRLATQEEIQNELERRNWSTDSNLAVDARLPANEKITKGVIQYFKINNQVFKGFSEIKNAGFGSCKAVIKKLDDPNNTNYIRISKNEYDQFLNDQKKINPS